MLPPFSAVRSGRVSIIGNAQVQDPVYRTVEDVFGNCHNGEHREKVEPGRCRMVDSDGDGNGDGGVGGWVDGLGYQST